MTPLEHDEQVQVVRWLTWRGIPHFAVPNAAKRSPKLAAYLRAEGLSAGVPDLWLPLNNAVIEMKRRDAVPSDTTALQTAWLERLSAAGWRVTVAHGSDEAIAWLKGLGL